LTLFFYNAHPRCLRFSKSGAWIRLSLPGGPGLSAKELKQQERNVLQNKITGLSKGQRRQEELRIQDILQTLILDLQIHRLLAYRALGDEVNIDGLLEALLSDTSVGSGDQKLLMGFPRINGQDMDFFFREILGKRLAEGALGPLGTPLLAGYEHQGREDPDPGARPGIYPYGPSPRARRGLLRPFPLPSSQDHQSGHRLRLSGGLQSAARSLGSALDGGPAPQC
jgi:hypothetical protein